MGDMMYRPSPEEWAAQTQEVARQERVRFDTDRLRSDLSEAVSLLRACEEGTEMTCPVCHGRVDLSLAARDHNADCALAALLAKYPSPEATPPPKTP